MKTSEVKSNFLVHASLGFKNLNEGQFTSILDTIVRCHPHYLTSYAFPKNWDTIYDITYRFRCQYIHCFISITKSSNF